MTADELAHFVRVTERHFGIRGDERPSMMADLGTRRAAFHKEPIARYLQRIEAGDRSELRALASELTVGETYFFRHAEQFHAFADVALTERLAARPQIRILSAGCSSGEEPYTMAMLVRDRVPDPSCVTIWGADLNPVALERAARGRYSRWALRATPPDLERRWFETDGREAILSPSLRSSVSFHEHNLVANDDLWAPGSWDVVFCRNVLMYFGDERSRAVIARISRGLAPGGYLFLGHAETLRERSTDFELCHTHGTFYYRRRSSVATPYPPPPVIEVNVPAMSSSWYGDIHAATERVNAIIDGALAATPAQPATIATVDVEPALVEIRRLYAQERFAEALTRLAELPPEIATDRACVLLRALGLTHAGRLAEAETACHELLVTAPAADAYYLLALCRASANDSEGAARHARRAIELDPSFAMARVQLGLSARRAGDRDMATRELARAIELLEREPAERLALFGGGFSRQALVALCRAELAAGGEGAMSDRASELRESFDLVFAQAPAPPEAATFDYLRVRIAGEPFAIALAEIASLHADLHVVALPSPAPELVGIAAVRAALVPIYDLRIAIGAAARDSPRWSVLLRGANAGFAFDGFDGHARTGELAAPSGSDVRALVSLEGRGHSVIVLADVLSAIQRRWPRKESPR